MTSHFDHVPYSVTISDIDGTIIYMNEKAIATFAPDGKTSLVGRNLIEFHGERAKHMIDNMLANGSSNSYTIEKKGVHKLIHQTPWFDSEGKIMGLIELSMPIPSDMPHYVRQ